MLLTSGLVFVLLVCATSASVIDKGDAIPAVEPQYLDMLLKEGRFEEFEYLMDITVPGLSKPSEENSTPDESDMNPDLPEGDILYSSGEQEEEARQGLIFRRRPAARWPNGVVPYHISQYYGGSTTRDIKNAINDWNNRVRCVKFREARNNQRDYAFFFPGRGCYAKVGRTGGQQPISIGRGCEIRGKILHEMEHTVGFAHEHNRNDRDNYVRVLWDNIPKESRSQYRKTDPQYYGTQAEYDYYSVMHYRLYRPGARKPSFDILKRNVNKNRIGQRDGFTSTDLRKISTLYC